MSFRHSPTTVSINDRWRLWRETTSLLMEKSVGWLVNLLVFIGNVTNRNCMDSIESSNEVIKSSASIRVWIVYE